jgi:hypothetical protein
MPFAAVMWEKETEKKRQKRKMELGFYTQTKLASKGPSATNQNAKLLTPFRAMDTKNKNQQVERECCL